MQQQPQEQREDRDKATEGMALHDLERLLADIQNQPEWRSAADQAASYYDGKQLSAARLAELHESGEPPTIINLMSGAINGALGQEAKTRLDWIAKADTDAFTDVADVLNERLVEAKRETGADQAISDAYKGQIVPGIGWVEVSRASDPLAYPYRVENVHRNEVWWDWRASSVTKSDGAWICRQRWVDLAEAEQMMPEHAEVFRYGCNTGPITDTMMSTVMRSTTFDEINSARRSFNRFEEEWLDNAGRRRVRFYSVYYKSPIKVVAMVIGTRRSMFRPTNPLHVEMVQRGIAMLVTGPSFVIRHAMFAGPFRLSDIETKHRVFPLIPFVGFEDDEHGTPYGLGAGMISPQDEYNERRSRLRWLLKACQTFVDDDALSIKHNNFVDLAREVMRPGAQIVLNANRKNANGLRVEQNIQLAREQVDVMQDAKQLIQEQPRIYSAMLGDAPTGVTSGLAINSLVEQGMVALGETNDNYRTGRGMVGNALMQLIIEDFARPNMRVTLGKGKKSRVVVLNTQDEQGLPINAMQDASVSLGLGDVPSTPGYKLQQQQYLTQLLGSVGNDPVARAVLMPALMEATDLPNREADAEWMRKKYGAPIPGEDQAEQQQGAEQQEQAMQQQAMQMQLAEAKARLDELQAKVAKMTTEAELNAARAQQIHMAMGQAANEGRLIQDAIAEAMG